MCSGCAKASEERQGKTARMRRLAITASINLARESSQPLFIARHERNAKAVLRETQRQRSSVARTSTHDRADLL
jgi:hypothetical protein